jgi:preprotein translocase subunit Sec61beta
MGQNGQLDKPTRARLLSYFSVHEHAAVKLTPKCQVCIGTTFRNVSIGRVLGHFGAGVSGANTCDYVNNVSPNDLNLFHNAAGLSESETIETSTNQNTKKQMSVDEGLTGMSNEDFNLNYARFIAENSLPLTLGRKRTTRKLFQKYANKEPPGATVVKQKLE